ncbi:MAG: CDP-alcohol phosphatidyltransferase family protein [Desulfobacterales bacterium]|nr:CDP-alcohol phosphatidyltransferase family protein [Desulfobacterales bacterium]
MRCCVFVFAGVSDGLDGLIARMLNQRSDLGAVLDPIADKLLLTAAYHQPGDSQGHPRMAGRGGDQPGCADRHRHCRSDLRRASISTSGPRWISKWTTVFQILTIGVSLLDLPFSGAADAAGGSVLDHRRDDRPVRPALHLPRAAPFCRRDTRATEKG